MNTTKTEAWKVEKFERAPKGCEVKLIGFRVVDAEGVEVCESFPKPTPVHVRQEYADLLASAPELKAALNALFEAVRDHAEAREWTLPKSIQAAMDRAGEVL